MKVKAAPGLKVPKESKPREYITDAKAVEVPRSAYYLRMLGTDLVEVAANEADSEAGTGTDNNASATKKGAK